MLKQVGFLGTGATLGADITLVVQVGLYLLLCLGIAAQLLKKYRAHDLIQTPVVLINLFFIIFLMGASFMEARVITTLPKRPGDPYYLTVALHAFIGTTAALLAVYCLLAGWKILPRKIGTLKHFMRLTFLVWSAAIFFGLGTYYFWYVRTPEAVAVTEIAGLAETSAPVQAGVSPPPRRVLMQNFAYQPGELTVVVGTRVIWVNQDGAPHNVTFADGSVGSDNYFEGEAFEHTFRATGTFEIYCTLHGSPGSGMHQTITVVEASDENVTELGTQPVIVEIVPPAPTPAPPVPPPPAALLEPPTLDDVIVGVAAFRDDLAPGDTLVIALSGLEPPPAGSEYHGWLVSKDNRVLDIGPITPDAGGGVNQLYSDPQRQNLMIAYDGFQITQEPQFDDDPTPGPVLYSGRQAGQAMPPIYEIVVSSPAAFHHNGLAFAARLQVEELLRHVEYVQIAYDLLSIADAQRHTEHILNIIDGAPGTDFDGKHDIQNPGDGFGLQAYIETIIAKANEAAAAPDATNAIRVHAGHVVMAGENALQWIAELRQAGLEIMRPQSIGDIGPQLEVLNRVGRLLLNGEDRDGNGTVEPQEGGIFTAYQHAQYMAAIGVASGAALAVVDPEPIAETGVDQEIAAGEVVVNMLDFAFDPAALTIPAGTQVRFVNLGRARHSATADDGSWDTGLLAGGESVVITFDQPGTFAYYCILHGTPGGSGMAGTITVTP
jgi:plastocyanin/uncharacterized membrane protein YozB (DUF420 family)